MSVSIEADAARLASLATLGGKSHEEIVALPSLQETAVAGRLPSNAASVSEHFPLAVAALVKELIDQRTEHSLRQALTILTDLRDLVTAQYGSETNIEALIVAPCRDTHYTEGSFALVQGVSAYAPDRGGLRNRGHGWGEQVERSILAVTIEVEGEHKDVWVDRFFKEHLGRLTEKRRALIDFAKPESIVVEQRKGRDDRIYYTASTESLNGWLARIDVVKSRFESEWKESRRIEIEKEKRARDEWYEAREEVENRPLEIGVVTLSYDDSILIGKIARAMHDRMHVRKSTDERWSFRGSVSKISPSGKEVVIKGHERDIKDFKHFVWVFKKVVNQEGQMPEPVFKALRRLYDASPVQYTASVEWTPTKFIPKKDLSRGLADLK